MQTVDRTFSGGPFGQDGVRWRIAFLLMLMTAVNYLDRQAMAIAIPVLQDEFGISSAGYGWITSGFLLAYAIGQGFAGRILDKVGTARGLAWAVVLWSIAGILHIFGRGFLSFFFFRALLGFFEGFNFPGAMKAVSEWFPKSERALGANFVRVGTGIGALLAPPLFGYLIYEFGWEAAFIVPGVIGFVWLIAWRLCYKPLESHPSVTSLEREFILKDRIVADDTSEKASWRELIRHNGLKGVMIGRFLADNLMYFYLFWLPLYLANERGFSLKEIAFFAWIPFLCSDLGGLFVGWLSGKLVKMGWTLRQIRIRMLWIAGLTVPITALAVFVENPLVALALVSFGLFANQFKTTSLFTLPTEMFPPKSVGTAWGMCGAAGSLGAMLAQPLIGMLADTYSYTPVFIIVSLLPLGAAIVVTLLLGPLRGDEVGSDNKLESSKSTSAIDA